MKWDQEKDYEINVRIKNARLINKMQEFGFSTARDLAGQTGISYLGLLKCLLLKTTVYDKKFKMRPIAEKLSAIFRCPATELFPESVWYEAMETTTSSVQMSEDEIRQAFPLLIRGEISLLEDKIYLDQVLKISSKLLTAREQRVINLRLDGLTMEEIGNLTRVSRSRVAQIEARAHRKMRAQDIDQVKAASISDLRAQLCTTE